MIHIFISASGDEIRPGSTGKPLPGYRACVLDEEGRELPRGSTGRLAVTGPTGCRYLDDARQLDYVKAGWNVTGDVYRVDEDGYFWFVSRADDMIVSAGYNIAGPEVEWALLAHPAVRECAVIAAADPGRGTVVKACIVLAPGRTGDEALAKELQDFVKNASPRTSTRESSSSSTPCRRPPPESSPARPCASLDGAGAYIRTFESVASNVRMLHRHRYS